MKLKRGINLGGFLSQCVHAEGHYDSFIHEEDIQKIASWGFDHVRLPIDSEVLEGSDGAEVKSGYDRVERVIQWCKNAELNIILDLHKVAGYDFNNAEDKEKNNLFVDEGLQKRFLNLWSHIARHYGNNDHVALELLNEVVEEENADAWNRLIAKAVKVIRAEAEKVLIIYGGISWNSAKSIPMLEPPIDENIMFTFHYYEPLLFTHQKAPWVAAMDLEREIPYTDDMDWFRENSEILGHQGQPVVQSKASKMGLEFHEEMIQDALDYAKKIGVSLYCGEFGVIDRAPTDETLKWFKDIGALFHKYDIGYALWSYKKMDFGLLDEHYDSIRKGILGAL